MTVYVIRHAEAGTRGHGPEDARRPLSPEGMRQAVLYPVLLPGVSRVLSSPYVRCVQTVEPLAAARGVKVELEDLLAEGSDPRVTGAWIKGLENGAAVCSHGDVISGLIDVLHSEGAVFDGPPVAPKGSIWAVHIHHDRFRAASYIPPP